MRVWKRQQWKIGPEERAVGPQVARTTCGPCQRKGGEDDWMRNRPEYESDASRPITIAVDWRLVMALVILILALLMK